MSRELGLGAIDLGGGRCRFTVWAPFSKQAAVRLLSSPQRTIPLEAGEHGYNSAIVDDISPETLYRYQLHGGKERPDPASRFQPQGVHGPSQVGNSQFLWDDESWRGLVLQDYIIYELHVGLFTPEGTFAAVIPHLDELKNLGITAVELMPVAQFPGTRNWGYDGTYPYAVQNSYGGPNGLKTLVNACHQRGLAVILDVVYNHLGPEGNYLADFGPYFTDRYQTPWGSAVNFDGAFSDEVRRFFVENALYWIRDFHIDALRIDAVHAIMDFSAQPFLEELAYAVHEEAGESDRHVFLIAESALNDTRVIHPHEQGGWGIDAQWNDDFHHSLHALLTGEDTGYYQDFGGLGHLVKAFKEGFVFSGEYSVFRKRCHGRSSRHIPAHQFVVFSQNHDHVGNRMLGERLSGLVSFEALKLAAGAVLTSPYIPLLFMGEEYGEQSPFLYFIDHSDPELIEAVRKGRREEFKTFKWQGEVPDPKDRETFSQCKLKWNKRAEHRSRVLLDFYQMLIYLRKTVPALQRLSKEGLEVSTVDNRLLSVRRRHEESEVWLLMNFSPQEADYLFELGPGRWRKLVDSAESRWMGPGSLMPEYCESDQNMTMQALSFVVYEKEYEE